MMSFWWTEEGQESCILFLFHFFRILDFCLISHFLFIATSPTDTTYSILIWFSPRSTVSQGQPFWSCSLKPLLGTQGQEPLGPSPCSHLAFIVLFSLFAGDFARASSKSPLSSAFQPLSLLSFSLLLSESQTCSTVWATRSLWEFLYFLLTIHLKVVDFFLFVKQKVCFCVVSFVLFVDLMFFGGKRKRRRIIRCLPLFCTSGSPTCSLGHF